MSDRDMMIPKKVIVVGLDGATFDIIRPLVKAGKLPTFAELMRTGVWGNLTSTLLPVTPPAWSSFMTGKNPGKHGVYGFYASRNDSYETEFATSLSIRAPKIWDYLGKGRRVGLIDIPLTYPPQKIDGVMISGMPVPSEESIFTHPPELHTELIGEIGSYMIDKELRLLSRKNPTLALKHLYDYTEMRMRAFRYLYQTKGTFDFFMMVLRGTDFIEHAAFKYYDSDYTRRHPQETAKYGQMISQFYTRIDRYLAEIRGMMDSDTTLVIMSDHGMGPLKKLFYINRWLKQEGFLVLKKNASSKRKGWERRRKTIAEILNRQGLAGFSHFLPSRVRNRKISYWVPYEKHPSKLVDWTRTRAFANLIWTDGLIKINLKGREPGGSVDLADYDRVCAELITKMKALRDPETGANVLDAVYRRDEIYSGPYLNEAPDIIALTRNIEYAYRVSLHGDDLFETPLDPVPATHRLNGIFVIHGPGIKKGLQLPNLHIMDVAPTVLYLMGCPVPADMDGRVITEAIEEAVLEAHPLQFSQDTAEGAGTGASVEFSEQERLELEENLRSLGYME